MLAFGSGQRRVVEPIEDRWSFALSGFFVAVIFASLGSLAFLLYTRLPHHYTSTFAYTRWPLILYAGVVVLGETMLAAHMHPRQLSLWRFVPLAVWCAAWTQWPDGAALLFGASAPAHPGVSVWLNIAATMALAAGIIGFACASVWLGIWFVAPASVCIVLAVFDPRGLEMRFLPVACAWQLWAALGLMGWAVIGRLRFGERAGVCLSCGYDLSGLGRDARCPECGFGLGASDEDGAPGVGAGARGRLLSGTGLVALGAVAAYCACVVFLAWFFDWIARRGVFGAVVQEFWDAAQDMGITLFWAAMLGAAAALGAAFHPVRVAASRWTALALWWISASLGTVVALMIFAGGPRELRLGVLVCLLLASFGLVLFAMTRRWRVAAPVLACGAAALLTVALGNSVFAGLALVCGAPATAIGMAVWVVRARPGGYAALGAEAAAE